MSTADRSGPIPFRNDDPKRLLDRLPPDAPEAEIALLGAMLVAGGENIHVIGEVMQIIKGAGDFAVPRHGQLYQVLIELYDRNQSLDSVQLIQELRNRQLLEQVGGADYVIGLADQVPIATNAVHYARIVRDRSKIRQLIYATARILEQAYNSSESADIVIDKAEKEIFEIAETRSGSEPTALTELVKETYDLLNKRNAEGRTLTGMATGFWQLDEMLSGLQPGEMIIVAARPSMGKTAFALNIAEYMTMDNHQPVAVFSLEMGKQQLAQRLMSSRSGVDAQRMRRNMLSMDEFHRLQEMVSEAEEAPMYIDDTPGLSVLELRAKARRLAIQHDIKAIFVDYLQLMSSPGSESRQQEVSEISRGVKALARELHVPVVCLSQLNRNPEGRESKKPMLSDLRESGSIEQDADVVMMLHREDYYNKANDDFVATNTAQIIIAKQRNGPTGVVELQFDGNTTRFHNLARGVSAGGEGYAPPPPPAEDVPDSDPPF
jgi:replicative DNA helicase